VTVRSQQLAFQNGGFATAGAHNYVFTCPAGTVTLLKFFDVVNNTGAGANTFVLIDKAGVQVELTRNQPLANGAKVIWTNTVVLEAGDKIDVQSSAAGIQFMASGAVLDLP
jgi:hypothetical protein